MISLRSVLLAAFLLIACEFLYGQNPAPPLFSPPPGAVTCPLTVTIAEATSGTAMLVTIDGSTPSTSPAQMANPNQYYGPAGPPISVSKTTTIKAMALLPAGSNQPSSDLSSTVAAATYTCTPVFTPTVSNVQGPTIIQTRCNIFTTAFQQWFEIYSTPEPTGYGIQMCTWITWPSNPVSVVTSGSLNVIIPVVYMGDPAEAPTGAGSTVSYPSNYPYGQSHANFSVTVTANDVTALGVLSGISIPDPQNGDCDQPTLIAGTAQTANFTASIAGDELTVTAINSNGSIALLSTVSGPGVAPGTQITGFGPGTTGSTGNYTVSISQSVTSEAMTTGATPEPAPTQNTGSITLYDFKAPDAPAGASATGQQAPQNSGVSYAQIVVPIHVTWAQSILTFQISVSQGVPGPLYCTAGGTAYTVSSDPENMCYELPQSPNPNNLGDYPFWTNQGIFNTANNPPSPATPSTICPGPNCACPQPQASEVDVVPFAAFQLGYLPLAVIYSPIGTGGKALAQYTLSNISGTQIQFGGSVTTVNSNTVDDKEALTGTLSAAISGLTTMLSGTSTWDSSVQQSESSLYGQMATVVNSNEIDEVLSNPVPAGWPATNKMDYYHEPFHNDIIVAAPNPQFFTWEYPDGYFAMPVGSEPFFEATVDQLAACASPANLALATVTASISGNAMYVTAISGSIPLLSTVNGSGVAPGTTVVSFATETGTGSTTGTYNLSIPQNVASETMTTRPNPSDCAALLAVDPFAVQDTQDANLQSYRPIDPNSAPLAGSSSAPASSSILASAGVSWTEKFSTSTNIQTNGSTTYNTIVTAINSNQVGATAEAQVSNMNPTFNFSATGGVSNTTSSTTAATSTSMLTSASADTLTNGVTTANAINDPAAPPGFSIDYRAMQDAYFGTIAIADTDVGNLPHCLLESVGVLMRNPPPGCKGVNLVTALPLCVRDGSCIKRPVGLNSVFSMAQANVFRRRHFVRPPRKPLAPAHVEFPAPAQMLKYLEGAKLPLERLTAIQKALGQRQLAPH